MKVFLHSDKPLTPRVLEIMKEVKERSIGDFPLEFAPAPERVHPNATVFAMSKYVRQGTERVVAAPSGAQIVTRADIVTRLGQAFKLLVDPPEMPPFRYKVLTDRERLIWALHEARDADVSCDIEVSGVVDEDFPTPDRIIAFSFFFGEEKAFVIPEELCQDAEVYTALCGFLEGNNCVFVNGKFDTKYFPNSQVNFVFDPQLAHYALNPAAGEHGLKPVTKKLFGFEDWDEPGKKYLPTKTYTERTELEDGAWADARKYPSGSGYERIPRTLLYEYAAFDVYATGHFAKAMMEDLEHDEDARKVTKFLMQLSDMFMPVEKSGVRLDLEYLKGLSKELHAEKIEAEDRLSEIAGREVNPRSPKQVKQWFLSIGAALSSTDEKTMNEIIEFTAPYRFGFEDESGDALVIINTELSTGDEQGLSREDRLRRAGDFAEQLLVCRGITKTLGTYVDGYAAQADEFGYVRPGFKLIASTTGRLGGKGASLLTIPREKRLKRMVLPDPGQVMVAADLSQAELRVMACESQDPWLIAAFQPGAGDFFDLLLSQAHPEEDWSALHQRVSEHTTSARETNYYNDMRASMKGVVYGASFGRGVPAIARAQKITQAEAQKLMNGFIRPGSPFAQWREMIERKALTGGEIVTKFGRHFQSELVTGRNRKNVINSALSFTSQSTANDICLSAALEVTRKLKEGRLMSTLHDALYLSVPESYAEEAGALLVAELKESGRRVYGDQVPFEADWGIGANMAEV